tara:strand:+ start:77 stop:469 length:393 start_codon:yes stop_codon:yes gene_type:complete
MVKTLLFKLGFTILALLAPIQDAMLAVGFLIGIDLIMGITAAYKTGEKLKSARLKNTVVKLLVYNLLLISSFIAETYLAPYIPFVKICLGFLATVEIASISENFQKITGISFLKYVKTYLNERLNKTKED